MLRRLARDDESVALDLSKILYEYSQLTKQGRIEHKIEARRLASFADWRIMIENYIRAHNLAVEKQWS